MQSCLLHFLLLSCCSPTLGKLVGGFIFPHGGIALDPTYFNTTSPSAKQEAWELHKAASIAGQLVMNTRPEVILLTTPHGVADLTNFLFFVSREGQGTGDTDNCACPPCCYNLSVQFDSQLAMSLLHQLQTRGVGNLSGISAFGKPGEEENPFPLRWGEVIPLHFIAPPPSVRVVVLSIPSRRYTEDVPMIPELISLGANLSQLLDAMSERVAVVVSGDLAHRFDKSGPFGYSNHSEEFDRACGEWAGTLEARPLLETAASIVDKVYSCGFTGFVLLHSLLQRGLWEPTVLANYHPSYYGMMVATFISPSSAHRELR